METLREGWAEYSREMLSDSLSESARAVVEHAFYHGVIALLAIGNAYRERGSGDDERQVMMTSIIDEILEYNARCELQMVMRALARVRT